MVSHGWDGGTKKILVACSGGLDSTVLLSLLHALELYELQIIHFNHQLRGTESEEDEAFVSALGAKFKIPVHVIREDVTSIAKKEGLSLEEAGSIHRRRAFRQHLHALGCDYVASGHHMDDQLETVLMNLYLGSGIKGIQGMSWEHEGIIRPLLGFTRSALRNYAEEMAIDHKNDSSNLDTHYLRNKIRHEIIPASLRSNERDPHHLATELTQSADHLGKLINETIEDIDINVIKSHSEKKISLGLDKLSNYFSAIQKAVFDRIFQQLSSQEQGLSEKHFEALRSLIPAENVSKEVQLPQGISVVRDRNGLTFLNVESLKWTPRTLAESLSSDFPFFRLQSGEAKLGNKLKDPHYFWLQDDVETYTIRSLEAGEKMQVDEEGRALSGRQILQESHVAPHIKPFFPVLMHDDEIIWLPGVRTAHQGLLRGGQLEDQQEKFIKVQYDEGTFE